MSELDSSPFDSFLKALNERKNLILGAIAVIALVVIGTRWIRSSVEDSAYEPWRTLQGNDTNDAKLPWEYEPEELATLANELDDEPAAQAIASYWEALSSYEQTGTDDEKIKSSLSQLDSFRKEFSDHYLMTAMLPVPRNTNTTLPPAQRVLRDIQAITAAGLENPRPFENPQRPDSSSTVTFELEGGDKIVVALYVAQAPESCRAFLKHAKTMEGQFIATAVEDSWVEFGMNADGDTIELEGEEGPFPPYEANGLSHFENTIAFSQRPFSDGPYNPHIKVWLKEDFFQDGRSTIFAEVVEGVDALERISQGAKKEEANDKLDQPVKIEKVTIDFEIPDALKSATEDDDGSSEDDDENASDDDNEDDTENDDGGASEDG